MALICLTSCLIIYGGIPVVERGPFISASPGCPSLLSLVNLLSCCRSTDYGHPMKPFFSLKSRSLGFGQTNWTDKFWGIWGFFGQPIRTHFGGVSPCFHFQPLFLKKLSLFHIQIYIWDWDLDLD